jgi:polysaccharide biosynthesis protein PslH
VDPDLAAACDRVEEVPVPARGGWLARSREDVRVGLGLLRGTPMWVTRDRCPALAHRIEQVAREWSPDVVQLEYHVMGQYLGALARCAAPRVLHELDPPAAAASGRLERRHGIRRAIGALDLRAWRAYERSILAQVQAVVVYHQRDVAALPQPGTETRVECIPMSVSIPREAADAVGVSPPELLFVGNFIHAPNADAAERLITGIFPRVRAVCPDAVLRIVGANAPAGMADAAAGIAVNADVPSVRPFLERAAVFVAPLRLGGGMRVKVLEALAAGKAVVATSLAVEGLAVESGVQLLLAEDDDRLAAAIIDLLRDIEKQRALATRARAWAAANLSPTGPVAAFERLYRDLISGGGHAPRVRHA